MDKFVLFSTNEIKSTIKELDIINNYKIDYNEEQLEFINNSLQDCKLLGIPGGGKTQSIIGKIIHHYKNNDFKFNNNFLILTFSRRACNDFLEKGKKQNKRYFTSKNIKTLHSLAGKIVYKVLDKKTSSQDTVIISSLDLIENNSESILCMDEFYKLKVIFVDEAQDISYIQYQLILKIQKITNCVIILIGDPNQNIYQFQNGSDQYLINHPGKNFKLIKNYRSTPYIVNFINYFRPWDKLTNKMISTKSDDDIFNKKPILFIGTVDEVIQDIINKILKSPFPKEEIAIIGPVKKSKPNYDSYTNIGLSLFTNLLNQYNINYIKHYEDTNNEESLLNEYKKEKDHINLFTIHGSKGLEFQQVFLINFHTSTFGIIPTEDKYKEFKYLWYVGLSRAQYDLNIYVDKNKIPWNELRNTPEDSYIIENYKPTFKELKFKEEIIPCYHTVTEIINSKKHLDDELLFNLENSFKYTIDTIELFESPMTSIKNYKNYSALYGMFIENIFNYYYTKKFNIIADFIVKLKKIIYNTIIIPKKYIYGYKALKIRCPFIKDIIKLVDLNDVKNTFGKNEEDLYSYLCETLNYNYNKEFYLDVENDVTNYSKKDLLMYIECLESGLNNSEESEHILINYIFKITIFYYQNNNETAYLWNIDFQEELKDLDFYIQSVIKYAKENNEKYIFHPIFRHHKLAIVGELDLYNENLKKIVDIKFSNNLNIKHILQVLIYQHLINPGFNESYELELWNFYLGNKYIIKLNKDDLNIFKILKILSNAINKKLENMIFIYDLETTGLAYSNKKIDIIERHFEEYTTGIVASSGLLKPVNVPFIPFDITKITGITKEMVYQNGNSMEDFKKEMNNILLYCNKPIFIAHNGNSFDHKIMTDSKILDYHKCKFLDSKMIIRLFLNNPVTNKSLSDIFMYLFNFIPVIHRAESDVRMLISIFRKLDISEEKILNM